MRIGKGCIISERVVLGTGAEEGDLKDERNMKSGGSSRNDDSDIDLGSNVVLESGVNVKEGCRIGEMSIVDVEGTLGTGSAVGRVSSDSKKVLHLSLHLFEHRLVTIKYQVSRLVIRMIQPFLPS